MTKTLSPHAAAAKLIRSEVKALGVSARVSSECYSGGNSVRVFTVDLDPITRDKIQKIIDKYEYGTFDGMTDCYNIDNRRDDIPQVKFTFLENDLSGAKREEIFQFVRSHYAGGDALPASYEDARNISFHDQWISQFVYREFARQDSAYWSSQQKKAA
jgi:hypothetical protein